MRGTQDGVLPKARRAAVGYHSYENAFVASVLVPLTLSHRGLDRMFSFVSTLTAGDREIGGYVDRAEDRFVRNVWNFIKNFQGFQISAIIVTRKCSIFGASLSV